MNSLKTMPINKRNVISFYLSKKQPKKESFASKIIQKLLVITSNINIFHYTYVVIVSNLGAEYTQYFVKIAKFVYPWLKLIRLYLLFAL